MAKSIKRSPKTVSKKKTKNRRKPARFKLPTNQSVLLAIAQHRFDRIVDWFHLKPREKVDSAHIPSVWKIAADAILLVFNNKRIIFSVVLIYGLVYFATLRALSGLEVDQTRTYLDTVYTPNALLTNLTVSTLVLSTAFGVEVGFVGALGLLATMVASMSLIYVFRHILANKPVSLRDAYYFGSEQFVPFAMIIALIIIQLLPFAGGATLYNAAIQSNLIAGAAEHALFIMIWGILSLVSAYWLASSLMGLYAISLPKMYPLQALLATGQLVDKRRLVVFRKILFIIVVLVVFNIGLILSAVWLWSDGAFIARDIAAVLSVLIFHSYLYTLYRTLI